MERIRLTDAVDKPSTGKGGTVARLKSVLTWQALQFGDRAYYVGAVMIARVSIHEKGAHPRGKYVLEWDRSRGNGGVGFDTEQQLHEFMVRELTKLT